MLRPLLRRLGWSRDEAQLEMGLEGAVAPRDAAELLARLQALGLRGVARVELTRNRTVMVSVRGGVLRAHEGYLGAPGAVLQAIVDFVMARRRTARAEAQRALLAWRIPAEARRPRRLPRTHPDDAVLAERLREAHALLNAQHFGGTLGAVELHLSRRLSHRLGHYAPAGDGAPAHIAISRRHLRRDGWSEALHTLLHEMVHQWQAESGLPLDHGPEFRRKAREVGVQPRATRTLR